MQATPVPIPAFLLNFHSIKYCSMKKLILFLIFVAFITTAFCQQSSPITTNYLEKSKKQKTAAWIMLGGGGALGITGIVISTHHTVDELTTAFSTGHDDAAFATGGVLALIGVGSMLGSIPLFISASHNRRKAMAVNVINEHIMIPYGNMIAIKEFPAISFKISLSKK